MARQNRATVPREAFPQIGVSKNMRIFESIGASVIPTIEMMKVGMAKAKAIMRRRRRWFASALADWAESSERDAEGYWGTIVKGPKAEIEACRVRKLKLG